MSDTTIIKQKAVTEQGHAKNLRNYINDPKALLRGFQHIRNPARWADEMARMRRKCGHDVPARAGAKNTILYHQVLAFLPDEADFNGGPLSPQDCMAYAKEYMKERYPHQQAAFALHRERCEEDGTERYAVHMAINRSNMKTGKRLWEGTGRQAKHERAAFVRQMDGRWGLKQVDEGVENSRIHKRQPQRVGIEKQILDRAKKEGQAPEEASYKYNLRKLCQGLKKRAASLEEYRKLLEEWGVVSEVRDGKIYVTDTDNNAYSFRLSRLDKALEENALEKAFACNKYDARLARLEAEVQAAEQSVADYQEVRTAYLKAVETCYREYRQEAQRLKGTSFGRFPQLRVPRIPERLAKDAEVRRTVLGYIRKSDDMRLRLASDSPAAATRRKDAGKTEREAQRHTQQAVDSERDRRKR